MASTRAVLPVAYLEATYHTVLQVLKGRLQKEDERRKSSQKNIMYKLNTPYYPSLSFKNTLSWILNQ